MACQQIPMAVRRFSTSNAIRQLIKPPVQVFGIAGRYASALYSAASKQKTLEAVEKDLQKFQDLVKTDVKLRDFIENRSIVRSKKSAVLKALAEKTSLKPESVNLLALLAKNGRLHMINRVINSFKILMIAHRGEVPCEVTTIKELDADQKEKLLGALKTLLKPGQSIHLITKIDPSIVGGLIVRIADKYVDLSVETKIREFTKVISISVD